MRLAFVFLMCSIARADVTTYEFEGQILFKNSAMNADFVIDDLYGRILVDDSVIPMDSGDLMTPVETGDDVIFKNAINEIHLTTPLFDWSSSDGIIRLNNDVVQCSLSQGDQCLSKNPVADSIFAFINAPGTDFVFGIKGTSQELLPGRLLPKTLDDDLIDHVEISLRLWDDPEDPVSSEVVFLQGDDLTLLSDGFRLGDFNRNGVFDADDIDLLSNEIRAGTNKRSFDIVKDSSVDRFDHSFWVHDIAQTFFGDSNLDGLFSSSDLVFTFQAGEYEDDIDLNSNWETGDWNGDGDFSSRDLVFAFADGGYERGPRQAVQTVPEPHGMLPFFALCLLQFFRRSFLLWS